MNFFLSPCFSRHLRLYDLLRSQRGSTGEIHRHRQHHSRDERPREGDQARPGPAGAHRAEVRQPQRPVRTHRYGHRQPGTVTQMSRDTRSTFTTNQMHLSVCLFTFPSSHLIPITPIQTETCLARTRQDMNSIVFTQCLKCLEYQ